MLDQIAYAAATLFVLWLTYRSGSNAMFRSGKVMCCNLVAIWFAQYYTQSYAPWLSFMIIDAVSAYFVSSQPAGRIQSYITGIYVAQIIVSVVFAVGWSPAETRLYLDILAFGGVCQLLILATGTIHHGRGRKMAIARVGVGGNRRAVSSDATRMEQEP